MWCSEGTVKGPRGVPTSITRGAGRGVIIEAPIWNVDNRFGWETTIQELVQLIQLKEWKIIKQEKRRQKITEWPFFCHVNVPLRCEQLFSEMTTQTCNNCSA